MPAGRAWRSLQPREEKIARVKNLGVTQIKKRININSFFRGGWPTGWGCLGFYPSLYRSFFLLTFSRSTSLSLSLSLLLSLSRLPYRSPLLSLHIFDPFFFTLPMGLRRSSSSRQRHAPLPYSSAGRTARIRN